MSPTPSPEKQVSPVPSPEKQVDALIALFQGCFARRKELEAMQWKLNLSIWSSIAAAGWGLRNEHHPNLSYLFAAIPVVHAILTHKFLKSNRTAVGSAIEYVNDLQALINQNNHQIRIGPYKIWETLQIAPTILLTVAAIYLIK